MTICPICKADPYEYVDVGVGYVPVAVNCCDLGYYLFHGWGMGKELDQHQKTMIALARRVIRLRQSHSPRKKARAQRILKEMY